MANKKIQYFDLGIKFKKTQNIFLKEVDKKDISISKVIYETSITKYV